MPRFHGVVSVYEAEDGYADMLAHRIRRTIKGEKIPMAVLTENADDLPEDVKQGYIKHRMMLLQTPIRLTLITEFFAGRFKGLGANLDLSGFVPKPEPVHEPSRQPLQRPKTHKSLQA